MDEKFGSASLDAKAPEAPYVPKLTLDPTAAQGAVAPAQPEAEKKEVPAEKLDIDRLSPEEQAAVRSFAQQIDITDSTQVINYGVRGGEKGLLRLFQKGPELHRRAQSQV